MDNLIYVILIVVTFLIIVFGVGIYYVITRLYRQLRKREAEAIESIIAAQERERTTVSREVHDNLGPMLSITQMQVGYLIEQVQHESEKELLVKMQHQLRDAIKLCRNIAHMISSEVDHSKSFQTVLQEQVAYINELGTMTIDLVIPEDIPLIDPIKATSLIRIFQELLVNTIRHAEANQVEIKIEKTTDYLHFIYRDNGTGFQIKQINLGLGIQNISKRIEIIGGKQLWNQDKNNPGMSLHILFPLQKISIEKQSVF